VVAFAWKALCNRIATKDNLVLRNVLPTEASNWCVLCNRVEESMRHLFLHCEVARSVWLRLMVWMNCYFIIPPNLFVHWDCWCGEGGNKKVIKGLRLVWHTAVWLLWKARNNKKFNNSNCEVEELVEEIKVLSWRWMLYRTNIPTCLFYEWCWNPRLCLLRWGVVCFHGVAAFCPYLMLWLYCVLKFWLLFFKKLN